MLRAITASLVFSVWTTSTRGTRCGGFQKCVPTTRSRCLVTADLRRWNGRTVAGEDRAGSHVRFEIGKDLLLKNELLGCRLDDEGGIPYRGCELVMSRHEIETGRVVAQQIGDRSKPFCKCPPQLGGRFKYTDLMTGSGKLIRNAVAH